MTTSLGLSWAGIVRLGLVQTSLGAIIVLTTTVINRVMVVELALPAMLPGILVGIHHAVQMSRPRFGHGSDVGGRTTGWIIGGMAVLAFGGVAAAAGTVLIATDLFWGLVVSTLAFVAIGLGASAAGTSTLVTLAKHVAPHRKAAAATIVWIMMIAGFAVTAGVAGQYLDPFTPMRLLAVTATVSAIALLLTLVSVFRLEPKTALSHQDREALSARHGSFSRALREVWQEPEARRFTIFVFVSMLAYSAQDLILEPFAGTVFSMTPGESTSLSGLQHGGVLLGMILVAAATMIRKNADTAVLRHWTIGGCLASAVFLAAIAVGGGFPGTWPLGGNVFLLGVANGAFAVAAIASMMSLASAGKAGAEGLRMGLWGASQAIAFALGGFLGTVAIDVSRIFIGDPVMAYGLVFSLEAVMFVVAAGIGMRLRPAESGAQRPVPSFGEIAMVEVLDAR
ncbi:BCD family MFS transporter [Congregibacter litoralis]|uniref:PUCC protein n=1 Tax=Congregibacter litoralis KT71 TaxID=314285 RepID=A4ACN8_9GAMM|nr:BCD family MFS transporter [Congregibacter litoralis]EAQ96252.1 PUCC protein [Congregibacter litoralis KT71]